MVCVRMTELSLEWEAQMYLPGMGKKKPGEQSYFVSFRKHKAVRFGPLGNSACLIL